MGDNALPRSPAEDTRDLAEAKAHEAEARKLAAEERKLTAEARAAEADAEHAAIKLDRERHSRRKELASDEFFHVYRFTSGVSETSVKACMAQLAIWQRTEPGCAIELIFTSPGGSVVDGLALFDYLQQLRAGGHHLTTRALGYAASMAGILLQAGDVRAMSPESWLLIHEAQFGAGGTFGQVEDTVEWVRKVQDRILDIFAARSKLSKAKIKRRWHRKDWWLSSADALKLGFVDEVG